MFTFGFTLIIFNLWNVIHFKRIVTMLGALILCEQYNVAQHLTSSLTEQRPQSFICRTTLQSKENFLIAVSTPVQNLTITSLTTSSVNFSWSPPDGIAPHSYRVTITKEDEVDTAVNTTCIYDYFQGLVACDMFVTCLCKLTQIRDAAKIITKD